jgi:hypothetical protein
VAGWVLRLRVSVESVVPALMYRDLLESTTTELVAKNSNLMYQFENLSTYPEQFEISTRSRNRAELSWAGELRAKAAGTATASSCVRLARGGRWDRFRTEEYQNACSGP